jgi:hypothetical protein
MGGGASQPQGSLNDSITVLGGEKSEQQEYDPATMRDLTEDDVDPYFVPDAARNTCFFCGDKFNLLTRGRVRHPEAIISQSELHECLNAHVDGDVTIMPWFIFLFLG